MNRSLVWTPLLVALVSATFLLLAPTARADEPAAHAGADCGSCHQGAEPEPSVVSAACRNCHGSVDATASNPFHARQECADCHAFHDVDRLRTREGEFARSQLSDPVRQQCAVCHGRDDRFVSVGSGHWEARAFYHTAVQELGSLDLSDACLRCHDRGESMPAVAGIEPPRFHRGASHPYGMRYAGGSRPGGFDLRSTPEPALPLLEGRIVCTTCHDLRGEENDLLARTRNPDGICDGCHVRKTDPWADGATLAAR